MNESLPKPDYLAEARAHWAEARSRIEADVAAATQEAFETNKEHIQTLEDGTEHLTLYTGQRDDIIRQVDVYRGPVEDGDRTTVMMASVLAERSPGRGGIKVHNRRGYGTNVWRLTESSQATPRFETGELKDGSFVPFDDELMASDGTVAEFGGYWPVNLREGSIDNPVPKPRGLRKVFGRAALRHPLVLLGHEVSKE